MSQPPIFAFENLALQQGGGVAVGHDPAAIHDHRAGTEFQGIGQIVGHHQHRDVQ